MRTLKSDIKLKSFSGSEFDYVCGEMQGYCGINFRLETKYVR